MTAAINVVIISTDRNRTPGELIVCHLDYPYTALIRTEDVLEEVGQLTPQQVGVITARFLAALQPLPLPTKTLEKFAVTARTTSSFGAVHDALVIFAEQTDSKRRRAVNCGNWQYEIDYSCLILAPATSQMHQTFPLDTVLELKQARYGFDRSVRIRARPISTQSQLARGTRGYLRGALLHSLLANISDAVGP